jgi:oligopeptidase B
MKKEPIAPVINKELISHGHSRIDPYYWMNQRDTKEVIDYLNAENAYAAEYFNSSSELQTQLLNEFESRIDPNEKYAPIKRNGIIFQRAQVKGKDYQQIFQLNGERKTLFLDENERAKGHSFYDLGSWGPSPNNGILALSEDEVGRRKYTIRFRNNSNGKFYTDEITNTDGSIIWANDNKTVFYVRKDPTTLREYQIYRHVLGSDSRKDALVYEEKDERFSVYLSKAITSKYIYIHSESSTSSETQLIDANNPNSEPLVFLAREKNHLYQVLNHENGFYILSNHKAENRAIYFSKEIPTKIETCQLIRASSPSIYIEDVLILKNWLITVERENGLVKIGKTKLGNTDLSYISLNEETYALSLGYNDDYVSESIYYNYNSFTTPSSLFMWNLNSNEKELVHQKKLIDPNFSSENYVSKRIWATANDGTKIPVSLIYKKGIDLKNTPCLLYGYGSYGYTLPDVFSATRLSLLDRGFVYAVAHIRGSKYMGEAWYENGKFLKKTNTFTDFINAAEYLSMKGYCSPHKMYAQGGSAGGLLMGAVLNMAPYLWKGIIAQVPFVDVVTTMLDESIPLTVGEFEEWGNPKEEDFYYYQLKYSPYDNVKRMDYPALYVTTGYHDSQVQYWEPMKWVAKLRSMRTNESPLIFDCNMDAGHGGGSGRSQERKELAKEFAFILQLEGITK